MRQYSNEIEAVAEVVAEWATAGGSISAEGAADYVIRRAASGVISDIVGGEWEFPTDDVDDIRRGAIVAVERIVKKHYKAKQ